jgi:predicted TIM-barrel fold metal-dependent hydrolase
MANMYIDEPRCKNLFRQCGKTGFPVLFHLSGKIGGCYGLVDDIYLPRLETVLKGCPETIFIGHAMGFWSEISSDVAEETRNGYPKGSVTAPGRLQDLMQKYPNLYGDLSADSGFNALTRDSEYGYKFLNDFQNRLLFGTDLCRINQEMPIVEYFRKGLEKGKISKAVYDKITKRNIKKLLNIKPYG